MCAASSTRCDITYGTNCEFGFDYLRDNGMATTREQQVQRGYHYAIVDEVDSILIDEARTPLIISGPATVSTHQYDRLKPLVEQLVRKQNMLCNRLASEAKEAFDKGDTEEGGRLMFKVKLGQPRNKQLLRMMEDPEKRKAIDKAELSFYQDTRKEELFALKEELFFTIDEKSHEADLSEQGRAFLNPDDPDSFVLPDLISEFTEIDLNATLSDEEKDQRKAERQQHCDAQAEQIHNISQLLRAYCLFEKDVAVRRRGKQGRHRRRIHRPQNAGPPLERWIAPGRRSQGRRPDRSRNPDPRHDHDPELFPALSKARGHDRHRGNRSERVPRHLQARRRRDSDQSAGRPRTDANDRIYKTRREKYNAVINEIREAPRQTSQPVLVGTVSVEASELLSRMLKREKIPHNVLNAKFHQQEAEIVQRAGQPGTVTISTNMAGRGTDIKLGPGVHRSRRPVSSSAPSATNRAESTGSCADVARARATRAHRGSTSASKTISCATSAPPIA